MAERFVRRRRGSWIGGVCAGIADRLGLPRILVRLLFVLANGAGLVVYLLLWTFTKVEPKK
ncbi:PspC domain-containing protein [Saccharopolyspora oryzae]|uniref:PspC domain-containing protein n=1 Tax=Saccharopolyspora oryzae TaxID=2997343 RepID=A0ABT4V7B6_9PSEU|nr:PspC domain-containing protein [Saccharopolyspora oryzae]MDA3629870.1 PspC domain-containing protein [Saccharopolyspora oryzae]